MKRLYSMLNKDVMRHLYNGFLLLAMLISVSCQQPPDKSTPLENRPSDEAPLVSPTIPGQVDEKTAVTLAVYPLEQNHYRPIIAAFEEENPDITVRLISTASVTDENETRGLANAADIFPYVPKMAAETHYLLNLQPLIESDPQFDATDFYPNLLPDDPALRYNLPIGASYPLIFYSKQAFDEASVAYPTADWTVAEFATLAQQLTQRNGDIVTRWGYVPLDPGADPLLTTQLERPLFQNNTYRLTDPDVVNAVSWFADLLSEPATTPWLDMYQPLTQRNGQGPTLFDLLQTDAAAMWQLPHTFWTDEADIGFAPIPHAPQGYTAEPATVGFAISQGTAVPQAAWRLLDYLSHQPPRLGSAQPFLPARQSVAESSNIWFQFPDDLETAVRLAAQNNAPRPLTPQGADLLRRALSLYVTEKMTVVDALATAGGVPTATPPAEESVAVATPVPTPATDVAEINFYAGNLSETNQLLPLIKQFHAEQTDIRIDLRLSSPEMEIDPLSTDCFIDRASALTADVQTAVVPMDPLLELDANLSKQDFYTPLITRLTNQDGLYGLPAALPIPYIEYNRALFDEFGVAYPSNDWTVAQFLQTAQQLTHTEDEITQYGYADYFELFLSYGPSQFGITLIDNSTAVPTYNYAAATEMVTWYADYVRVYQIQPPFVGEAVESAPFAALLSTEAVAMWPDSAATLMRFTGSFPKNLAVGVAPLPTGPVAPPDVSEAIYAYFISATSPHKEACWTWITYLTEQPTATGWLPAHRATAESAVLRDITDEALAEVLLTSIQRLEDVSIAQPTPQWMAPGYGWLVEAYGRVARGEADVTTALNDAQATFDAYRECVIENDAFFDPEQQALCQSD